MAENAFTAVFGASLRHERSPELSIVGEGSLPSAFAVTDLAVASIAAAAREVAALIGSDHVAVDRVLASMWFQTSIRPIGWDLPAVWDAVAGDYETADGWIRLHTNAAHHRAAAMAVLDLTRILAGPVGTRFLAGYGAEVLRIDPPGWDEPSVAPDVTLGKRCARLNLRWPDDRKQFAALVAQADVFVHGYRSDALKRLGFGTDELRQLSPGLVDVALDAYGWSGPWATRRGFDSLVQMSSGIAAAGMQRTGAKRPVPLPVQALDHAAGYLVAAAAVRGLRDRCQFGRGSTARLSLARTAVVLIDGPAGNFDDTLESAQPFDSASREETVFGPLQRLTPPLDIAGAAQRWTVPADRLGSSSATW